MSIQDVIERSRQPGTFSERRRFSVARSRAIQKLRHFALADASYYVLEWIQAAIANGATYLDLAIAHDEVRMSYVGGGFKPQELEALFDFLFASKDDLDVADVRQLALGVNALMMAEPESIVIESGDGTLEGTTRIEIEGRRETVYVGTPTRALDGTFVRASGLRRRFSELRELSAIEERCLTATIPILVNDQPLFGYRAMRSPELFGYKRTLKFDEGDLYGTLGLATTPITRNFKLLTWGVWVSTTRWSFEGLPPIGGVVAYDRLRKTADHANVVEDEVYRQMWARLEPYARQVASGKSGVAAFDVRTVDGAVLSPQAFRELVTAAGGAVVFDVDAVEDPPSRELASRFGEALEMPVLLVAARDRETVRHLGGPDVKIWAPRLDPAELEFFARPVAADPRRPWLVARHDVEAAPDELTHFAYGPRGATSAVEAQVLRALRSTSSISCVIFTPRAVDPDAELVVEIRTAGRRLWGGNVSSPFPGHHLVVELDNLTDAGALVDGSREHPVAREIAEVFARWVEPELERVALRALQVLSPVDVRPTDATGRLVLAALARGTMKRVRERIEFVSADERLPDCLLEAPILRTVAGHPLSLTMLAGLMPETMGLVYGTLDAESPSLEGLDTNRILALDPPAERMIVSLLGPSSYVRIDDRAPLSAGDGLLRDVVVGLGSYVEGPLLVEGAGAGPTREQVAGVVASLLARWRAGAVADTERRKVLRHLVWYAAHAPGDWPLADEVRREPLFRNPDGRALAFADVAEALSSPSGLEMFDGWSVDPASAGMQQPDDKPPRIALAMNPFVFYVLRRIGVVRPVVDADLSAGEARANPATPPTAFLESAELSGPIEGRIGFPIAPVSRPAVLLTDRDRARVTPLGSVGADFGIVGRVRLVSDYRAKSPAEDAGTVSVRWTPEDVERFCAEKAGELLDNLIRRLPAMSTGDPEYERTLQVLLGHAARRISITTQADGSLTFSTFDVLTRRILDLPLFPTADGVSATGARLLKEFTVFGDREPHLGRAELARDLAAPLQWWLEEVLTLERLSPAPRVETPQTWSDLTEWLDLNLQSLRPDPDGTPVSVRIVTTKNYRELLWSTASDKQPPMVMLGDVVTIPEDFWLLQGATDDAGNLHPERASWLLLAVYAFVNGQRTGVSNLHEMQFQSRVLDWLESQ